MYSCQFLDHPGGIPIRSPGACVNSQILPMHRNQGKHFWMRGDKEEQEPRKVLGFPFRVDFCSPCSAVLGNTLHANEVDRIANQVENTGQCHINVGLSVHTGRIWASRAFVTSVARVWVSSFRPPFTDYGEKQTTFATNLPDSFSHPQLRILHLARWSQHLALVFEMYISCPMMWVDAHWTYQKLMETSF